MRVFINTQSLLCCLMASAMLAAMASCSQSEHADKADVVSFAKSAELGSVEYTVVKAVKANDIASWYKVGDRKILFSCKATLKAGIDLSQLTEEDVVIDNVAQSIVVNLPAPKLLSLNIQPDDVRLEYEKVSTFRSGFSAEERNNLLQQGEKDIRDNINTLGILKDAENNARIYFESMLGQLGYKHITVNFL